MKRVPDAGNKKQSEGRQKCQKAVELAPKVPRLKDDENKALDAVMKICK